MCCPSINRIILEKEINLEAASTNILESTLWRAFSTDLPQGVQYLCELALEVRQTGKRILRAENPDSALGQQLAHLLGADIAQKVCENRLDVAFGFYHACTPVAAPEVESLDMNAFEQIELMKKAAAPLPAQESSVFDGILEKAAVAA